MIEAKRVEGPVSVKREQGRRFVVVQSNVKDRGLVGFVEEAQSRIGEAVNLPTGYQIYLARLAKGKAHLEFLPGE